MTQNLLEPGNILSMNSGQPQLGSAGQKRKRASADDYTIALIVPLSVELAPVRAMLDEVHDSLSTARDYNFYTLGEIGPHNVVIVSPPSIGNNDSGPVANQLLNDFPNIRFGFLTGIGGGVPQSDTNADVRLGDVVVCEATGAGGAVIQLDRGRKFRDRFEHNGHLNKPHAFLRAAVKTLKAQHEQEDNRLHEILSDMLRRYPALEHRYQRPSEDSDQLFQADSEHASEQYADCNLCDSTKLVIRSPRQDAKPKIHYGPVGSSNAVIKSAKERDRLKKEFKILSVEMEAAGLMDVLPCLVVRGICDYADSHKNKEWQPYAAAVAAAYVKELLLTIPPSKSRSLTHLDFDGTYPQTATKGLVQEVHHESDARSSAFISLLNSLAFDRLDDRQNNITYGHPATCKWLFEDDIFRSWINKDNVHTNYGFFWIKGKPGSGKSTIMKTTLDWMKNALPKDILLTYFFNARGPTELEKSSLGLYRSLTYQLLQKCSKLEPVFYSRFKLKLRRDKVDEWTMKELQNFLYEAIPLIQEQDVSLFIDALDEGEEVEARALVDFLENLSLKAVDCNASLRICLSSRHYPQIILKSAVSIVVERHPGQQADLKTYISHKLGGLWSDNESEHIQRKIFERSAGVFLWVALVIPMLKRAYDRGRESELSQCLEHLPQDINDVFESILSRSEEDIEQCHTLLRHVLCAIRPLQSDELYAALQPIPDLRPSKLPSQRSMTRYIIQTSRGLVEVKSNKIFLIHDLVRSFLIKRGTQMIPASDTAKFIGTCHDELKRTCFECLHLAVQWLGFIDMKELDYLDKVQNMIRKSLPLFDYATGNVLGHAEQAISYGVDQLKFLTQLVSNERLKNYISGTHKYYFVRPDNITYTPSLILRCVDEDNKGLLARILSSDLALEVSQESFLSALRRACATGHEDILCVLLDSKLHSQVVSYNKLLRNAIIGGYARVIHDVIRRGVDADTNLEKDTHDPNSMSVLQLACGFGTDMTCIRALLDAGLDVNIQGGIFCTALQAETTLKGREEVVRLLLDSGADVNIKGGKYGSALGAARAKRLKTLEKILLDAGAVE